MIDRQRVALQLKMNQMDQGPAHRQQWRITSGGIEEIALAGRIQALDAVARVDLQLIAADDAARRPPVYDRQRAGGDVVGGAEMGPDPEALGAKLLQLTFRPETDQAAGDGARRGVRLAQPTVLQGLPGNRKQPVPRGNAGEAPIGQT